MDFLFQAVWFGTSGGWLSWSLFVCFFLFLKERDKKPIKLGRYGGGEDLGKPVGRGNMTKIHCVKKKKLKNLN